MSSIRSIGCVIIEHAFVRKKEYGGGVGEKSIRLVTALVECRPDGEYVPWGIKWYDGRIFPFAEVGWHETRSWVLGEGRVCESWRVKMGDGTLRDICHHGNSWYVVHDMDDDRPDDGWSP